MSKLQKLQFQFSLALLLLVSVVVSGIFIFSPISIRNVVQALDPANYNKQSGDPLTHTDWNRLDADFVARDNGTANNLTVNNLTCTGSGCGGGGQEVFVSWGTSACPSGTNRLYQGFAHGSPYNINGSSAEFMCLKYPLVGTEASNVPVNTGHSYGANTGHVDYIPRAIPQYSMIKCSVCQVESTCYYKWGEATCDGGFSPVYRGWIMTQLTNSARQNQINYICLNNNMGLESNVAVSNPGTTNFTPLVGATIPQDPNIGLYTTNSYMQCAYCCR